MNGVLGSVSTNHHAIEAQFMRKFTLSQHASKSMINSDANEIQTLLSPLNVSKGSNKHDDLPEIPFTSS